MNAAAGDFINDVLIDNLARIEAFSALPVYRDILLGIPAPSAASTASTAAGGFINDVLIDNLARIEAFSALPVYRDILLGIPAPSAAAAMSLTAQDNQTNVPLTGKILSTSLPSSGDPGTWTPRWSPTNGDNGRNNDPSGSVNLTLPVEVKGGTSQPEEKRLPSFTRDARKSTADTQSTGNSGTSRSGNKFEPNPIIFDNGSRGAPAGMFSGLGGLRGLFGGKDQSSSTDNESSTSEGPTK